MKINLDQVPRNLSQCLSILKAGIEDGDRVYLKANAGGLHFSLGMYLRNNWSLWDKDTVLVKWFQDNFGIVHADDISGVILEALSHELTHDNSCFDAAEYVKKYHKHWINL